MTTRTPTIPEPLVEYPDCDGNLMSDNTLQYRWIVTIQGNLDGQFDADPNVFVAGDLLWYPVKGSPKIRTAPDVLLAFGRPKGRRGSYKQWEEGGIAPQVVWEVRSPGNLQAELDEKLGFFDRYGVDEYYLYDPDDNELFGWKRAPDGRLQPIPQMDGWVSPLMGIRFDMSGAELVLYHPNGEPFLTFVELMQRKAEAERQRLEAERLRREAERERWEAEQQRRDAELRRQEAERQRWEAEQVRRDVERRRQEAERKALEESQARQQAEQQAEQALRQTEQERKAREEAQRRAELLAERLRALGINPDETP